MAVVRIVDDNDEYRNSEAFMLRMFGYNVVEYVSALSFLEEDNPAIPGCVILDVKMPEMTGIELQQVMTEKEIGLPIIFLTGHGDVEMAVHTLQRGASGFLLKPVSPDKLKESVEKALETDRSLRELQRNKKLAKEKFESLTMREKEVCELVVKGLLNKQIAIELGITEHTVKVHRASIKYKLQVNTPVALVNLLQEAKS
ncbi:MAG: response regulator transcription factor [Burkholderiales bacterium]|nr:response regulator transcription factor [Burkholderiales bacterium]